MTSRLNLNVLGRWFVYAGLVGAVAGLGAIAFQTLSHQALHFFLEVMAGYSPSGAAGEAVATTASTTSIRIWLLPLVPALGGLLAGLLVYGLAPEAEGHGTDSAIHAFHQDRGRMRARVPLIKMLASALTIGSGGSGGREGPIAQIGAGFGSFLATRLGLSERDRRILLAAGVGAGVGSIFRAPLAGALFAAEILYSEPEFESDVVIPAALTTIVAYCVFSLKYGFGSLFSTPAFTFRSPLELVPYTILAVTVALGAGAFVKIFYGVHDLFSRLPGPRHLRPMLGGFLTGLIGLLLYLAFDSPRVLDVMAFGYGSLQEALEGRMTIPLLLVLALGKMLTTSLSIGSGGSGGVFGPSMVIGGSLGGVVGLAAHALAPEISVNPGAYVVVGMAGFFAAAANTPISTLVMVSEMTGNYRLLLPSLWVCCIAYLMGRRWSLYRSQVPTRLNSPAHRREYFVDLLEGLTVGDVSGASTITTLPETAPLDVILESFAGSSQEFIPVVDGAGELTGMVSLRELRQVLEHDPGPALIARDIASPPRQTLVPAESIASAMQKFVTQDVNELPVVAQEESSRLVGMLTRGALMEAYHRGRLARLQESLPSAE